MPPDPPHRPPRHISPPHEEVPSLAMDGSRLGVIERLASVANRMTLQNVINIAILVAIAIPTYGAWRFFTDEKLRNDLMNTVNEISEFSSGCSVYETNIGGNKRFHISAFVLPGPDGNDYLVTGRMRGDTSRNDLIKTCERLVKLADHLREKVPDIDERYTQGGSSP